MDLHKRDAVVDAEKDFHKNRVAFMIVENKLLFLENSEMSHFTWAKTLGIDEKHFEKLVRGFYKNNIATFYKGNFVYDAECIEVAKKFAKDVKSFVNASKLEVWCGHKIGKIGELWPPDFYVETI